MPERLGNQPSQRSITALTGERHPRAGRKAREGLGISDGPAGEAVLRRDRIFRRSLIAADAAAAVLAIVLVVSVLGDDSLRPAAFMAAPIAVLVSKVIGLYDRDELVLRKSTLDESPQLFQVSALYALLFSLLQSHTIDGRLSSAQVVEIWALLFGLAFAGRVLARRFAWRISEPERCLVVGDPEATAAIGDRLERDGNQHQVLAARLPLELDGSRPDTLETLWNAVVDHDAHRVILAPRFADSDAVLDAIRLVKALGVKVSLLPRHFEVVGSSVVFDDLDGVTVLGVRRFGLTRSSAAIKRATDLLVAAAGLLVTAPLFVLIAVAIRLDTPGPLLFRQVRVGKGGKHFEMLKFRSMVRDAEAEKPHLRDAGAPDDLFKLVDDPRVTRVGRWLRSTSLDELPQFFNVLRGDMSLVGPRPLVADEDALVEGWHRRRLHLTPGMTGPWQVLGATRVPLPEMVKIDYLYIANWSLWRDVKIVLRTIAHVLRRDGV